VQSHELAHDPAARSWPRPRARGARATSSVDPLLGRDRVLA